MTTLTLEMPDEVRALIDEARGDQDVASFMLAAVERAARRQVANRRAAPTDELTAADHIRMADAGEITAHSLEESRRRVFAQLDAEEATEAKRR